MDTQKQLLTYRFRWGTNGSDVLLPSPLLLLPCHEQLRLISSYCFMRRAKCRFASLLFLSRLLSVTSNLSLYVGKVFVSLSLSLCVLRRPITPIGNISTCFTRVSRPTDNVIRILRIRYRIISHVSMIFKSAYQVFLFSLLAFVREEGLFYIIETILFLPRC